MTYSINTSTFTQGSLTSSSPWYSFSGSGTSVTNLPNMGISHIVPSYVTGTSSTPTYISTIQQFTSLYGHEVPSTVTLKIDGEDVSVSKDELIRLYKEDQELKALAEEVPMIMDVWNRLKACVKLYRE